MWFDRLTGFREENPDQVRKNLEIAGNLLISKVNGMEYTFGKLEVPDLGELRKNSFAERKEPCISISEVVDDVRNLHQDAENAGSVFQVASQFNLLEMVNPYTLPEDGVAIYQFDNTQGPACAIACGAGTIYRNYFAEVNGQSGQTMDNQIDCLEGMSEILDNKARKLWKMSNGYALINSARSLEIIAELLENMNIGEIEELRAALKVGIQWDTEVTISDKRQLVTQVYCSALPVSYTGIISEYWEPFASLVLEAAYEACFYAAARNMKKNENNKLFLTMLGGGAFGNDDDWIINAIRKPLIKFQYLPLDVRIVSYNKSNPRLAELLTFNSPADNPVH